VLPGFHSALFRSLAESRIKRSKGQLALDQRFQVVKNPWHQFGDGGVRENGPAKQFIGLICIHERRKHIDNFITAHA